jgi:hypothetical protein
LPRILFNIFVLSSTEMKVKRILQKNKINLTIALILVSYIYVSNSLYFKSKIFFGDSISYYTYLPALLIHHDITLKFAAEDPGKYDGKMFYLFRGPNGNYIIKASSGLAWMLLPFFLIAHVYAQLTQWEANGFTEPYKVAIIIGTLIYVLIGLKLLSKILLRYFSEKSTVITLLIIGVGTNLMAYSTIMAAIPHAHMFVFIIVYFYLVIKWYEKPSWKYTILLGLVGGLVVLTRPNYITVILLLLFYDIKRFTDIWPRVKFLFSKFHLIFVMFLFSLTFWIPQFLYWKMISGHFIVDSYQGASFNFDNPQVISQLFSYRKGWLLYTPMMIFAFVGLYTLYHSAREVFIAVVLFLIANIYVLSSWYAWWFAGSFGSRGYVNAYGILALPIASMVAYILSRKMLIQIGFYLILTFFTFLNIFQMYQYSYRYIHQIAMTKKAYWSQFLRWGHTDNFTDYLIFPNVDYALKGIYDPRLDYTYKEWYRMEDKVLIKRLADTIRKNPEWLKAVEEKAKARDIHIDKMLELDAWWTIKSEIDNQKRKIVEEDDNIKSD